jgi:hypothetical protein
MYGKLSVRSPKTRYHLTQCLVVPSSRCKSEVQPLVAFIGSSLHIMLLLVVAHCAPNAVTVAARWSVQVDYTACQIVEIRTH